MCQNPASVSHVLREHVHHSTCRVAGSGVTLTMFTFRRPPAEIFGAPTKYKIFTVF